MTEPASDAPSDASGERREQLRAAGLLVAGLALVGALLGLVWQAWSPPGPIGIRLPGGIQPDETESWAAGDGRFAVIVFLVGLLAGIAAWYLPVLRRARGPWVALGLAVGGFVGALLMNLVGWAVRGSGSNYSCGSGTCVDHLPLTVHMRGLWFLEAFIAVLVYGLFVAFAVSDDLGRPDPGRQDGGTPPPPASVASSVGPQGYAQDGGRDGDAASAP